MKLHELKPAHGSRQNRKRVGRGIAAGQGKTSGRGQKGQGSRKSSGLPVGFEGGQLSITKRSPYLRGFTNKWRREYAGVNIGKLNRFKAGDTVDAAALAQLNLIANASKKVKLLATGDLKLALTVKVHQASAAAKAAVEKAGGSVELLEDAAARWANKTKRAPGATVAKKSSKKAAAAEAATDEEPAAAAATEEPRSATEE